MNETRVTKNEADNTIIFERDFSAPLEVVWQAFTEVDKLNQWWGPRGWETTTKTFDFTPGGQWHYMMKCVDEKQKEFFGQESWGKSVYDTIDPQKKFTYTDYFSDAEGGVNTEMPAIPVSVEFSEESGRTKVKTIVQTSSRKDFDDLIGTGMIEGLSETWDKLEEFVTQ